MEVEVALKKIEVLAAMVSALAANAARGEGIEAEALLGVAESCAQIQQLAHDTRKSLTPDALAGTVETSDES